MTWTVLASTMSWFLMRLILHRYVRPSAEVWCLHRGRLTGMLSACDGLHSSPGWASRWLLGRDWLHDQPPAHGDVRWPRKQVVLLPCFRALPLRSLFLLENVYNQENFIWIFLFPEGSKIRKIDFLNSVCWHRKGNQAGVGSLSVISPTPGSCTTKSSIQTPPNSDSFFLFVVQICLSLALSFMRQRELRASWSGRTEVLGS